MATVIELGKSTYGLPLNALAHAHQLKRERDVPCVPEDLSVSAKKRPKKSMPSKVSIESRIENDICDGDDEMKTDIITEVMDIQEPLSKLRNLLTRRLRLDLSSFQIWLQDKIRMQPNKCLNDQCIQSEGLAQIKVELKQYKGSNRINILDVLKYPEDSGSEAGDDYDAVVDEDDLEEVEDLSMKSNSPANLSTARSSTDDDNAFVESPNWVMCTDTSSIFPVPLPNDPLLWSNQQLQQWLLWAMQEFGVSSVSESMWKMNGQQLCQLSLEEFREKVRVENLNFLWNHIELLKKFRIFAVVDKPGARSSGTSLTPVKPSVEPALSAPKVRTSSSSSSSSSGTANRRVMLNGHNGQIQLWQFLLELLGDRSKKSVIQWVGRDGEFKLCDPELVAKMWGERKNKPKMNYEKLSRALRYYYAEAMIAKVHGRRFVYKFVCNLKELVGCTTEELISMVEDEV